MIRKVENYNAWVCKVKDIWKVSFAKECEHWLDIYQLPLFSTKLIRLKLKDSDPEELVLIYDHFASVQSIDFIERVNQTWNKFYD